VLEHFLDALAQFGGGRGDLRNLVVRFLLASFFWGSLLLFAQAQWRDERRSRDRLIVLAAILGLARELAMLFGEYGAGLGYLPLGLTFKFYPPFEHALTMSSGLLISYAFINYFSVWPRHARRYLILGALSIGGLYLVVAPLWIGFLASHPGTKFGAFWGDMAFRLTASVILGTALTVLAFGKRRGKDVSGFLLIAILFLFLDEFSMIFNLAQAEVHVEIFAPIRHNLHIWAIPLLIGVYNKDLRRREREARRKTESIIAALGDGLSIQDCDHRIVFQNDAARALMGEQVDKHRYQAYFGEKQPCGGCPLTRTLADGQTHYAEIWSRERDRCLGIHSSPLWDARGDLAGAVEVFRDLTASKQTEREIENARRIESIGLLAGGIAHDFNNLLTATLANLTLARDLMQPGEQAYELLAQVEKASLRARDLAQRLLTFAKGGAPVKQILSQDGCKCEPAGPPDVRGLEVPATVCSNPVLSKALG